MPGNPDAGGVLGSCLRESLTQFAIKLAALTRNFKTTKELVREIDIVVGKIIAIKSDILS